MVIACDGREYWRKDIFPQYKANRKKARDESTIDWNMIFDFLHELREDIDRVFPYKVVKVHKAEADDIIGVLTKYTQDNEQVRDGIMMESQPVIVISEDLDFVQLYKYDNFKLYLPRKKKLYPKPSQKELREFIIEHIVKAGDDGIPNILSPDDIFVQEPKGRQTTVSAKRLTEFKEIGRDACRNDIERRGWDRNSRLIEFEHIPEDIVSAIVDTYKTAEGVLDRNLIFNYLVKNRCRQLLNSIEEF